MTFVPKPNSGTLFPNERRDSSDQPDMTGNIHLDSALLRELLDETPEGELVKIQVSAWNNDGGRIGLRLKKPFVPKPKPVEHKIQAAEPQLSDDFPF